MTKTSHHYQVEIYQIRTLFERGTPQHGSNHTRRLQRPVKLQGAPPTFLPLHVHPRALDNSVVHPTKLNSRFILLASTLIFNGSTIS